MSHTVIIINKSLLEIFDPSIAEYAGVREHYSAGELTQLDALRTRPSPASYSFAERLFICWALDKAVLTAQNQT